MEVLVLKLNGWPNLFDERVDALAEAVDRLVLIRPKPAEETATFDSGDVQVYDLPPRRGAYVPAKAHAFLLPLYVVQAVLLGIYLALTDRSDPDVIHALDYVLGGVSGAILSWILAVPLVLSVRGLAEVRYERIVENNPGLLVRFNFEIVKLLPRLIFPFADHVVTKARYQQDYVREKYGVDPGFTTVPTGVDFEKFDCEQLGDTPDLATVLPAESTLRSGEHRTFLYLGKVIPEKGVGDLVNLVIEEGESLPDDVRFEIVGDIRSERFERELRRKIERTDSRVQFTPGAIPFESIPAALCAATGVVLFSTPGHEGTPRILQEACAAGTPILASDVDGIRGAFSGMSGCELIDVDDSAAFRAAVERICDGVEMNREAFREHFDLYRNYAKYQDVYGLVTAKETS